MKMQMIGGSLMKNYYKRRYFLSEEGAKNSNKAIWLCFLTYAINLIPIFFLMALFNWLILGIASSPCYM